MKRLIAFLTILGMTTFVALKISAQDDNKQVDQQTQPVEEQATQTEAQDTDDYSATAPEEEIGIHKQLKIKFIEGGATFMSFVLLCLILGLAVIIERIIYLRVLLKIKYLVL